MFCWITDSQKYGLGKIIQIEKSNCIVEYFDSPASENHYRVNATLSTVRRKRLGRNTRVFIFDDISNQWSVGRVLEDDGEGVEVRLSHKRDIYLPYERVFVRWKYPIKEPIDFLSNLITETPQYAEARSGFMQNYISQRGAAFGISALLSSSIELEPHQIEVVKRVLSDHTQRYLLADEVGLGKTIEAGIVIRQVVLDDMRGHKVVVLVPHELVDQWREELITRFGLADFIDESLFVLPQEDSAELREACHNLSLLVIDEAHHLTASNVSDNMKCLYEFVREIARGSERLLLLSATPILRNENGFLRMLHLLDPVVYPLENIESFRAKVLNRQTLAETVASLEPGNSLFMDSLLDDLTGRLPDDSQVIDLSKSLKEKLLLLPDETDPEFCASIRQLRAHLSETYKLNRRILRNRRTQVIGLTPERKGVQVWNVETSSMERVETALENWRVEASQSLDLVGEGHESGLSEFYWKAACALSEGLHRFHEVFVERQGEIIKGVKRCFDGEVHLIESILRTLDISYWIERRLKRLEQGLSELSESVKAVIFCSSAHTADMVFSYLKQKDLKVVRHSLEHGSDNTSSISWKDFLSFSEVRALVCDHSAEEGINLQGGNKAIIHFDLPLQPNRIEQRMGRVDRYGSGNPVISYVLLDNDSPLQLAWFGVLDTGLGVFDRSISSLQYLVESELAAVSTSLIHYGAEGLNTLRDRLAGSSGAVAREFRLINQQDALDELSPMPEQELDDLFDADAAWKEIKKTMLYWIEETLLFSKIKLPKPPGNSSMDDPFRFHYCPPEGGTGQPTLIPLSEFLDDFLGAVDFEAPGNRSTRPQSYPYVTHRPTAVKRSVRPLRYGTEFVESVRSFSEVDVRGRSYAMWRQIFGEFKPMEIRTCFRFDFLVETRLDEALEILTKARRDSRQSDLSSLARRGDTLFRPKMIQVWLDEDGDELSQEFINRYLAAEYKKQGDAGYIDKNLSATYLTAFKFVSSDIGTNWRERCVRMSNKAKAIARSNPKLVEQIKDSLERGQSEDEVRHAQLKTRIQALDGSEANSETEQLQLEKSISRALHNGISSPSLKPDVAGVVFLTSEPVSILEEYLKVQQ